MYFQPRDLHYCISVKKYFLFFLYFFLRTVTTEVKHNLPSALKKTNEHTTHPVKSHSVEFATPPVKQYHEQDQKNNDFCFERASVPPTQLYGEVPEKLYREGDKVSDLRYLDNSTKGEVNTKTPETFEDICDGTYNDYLCIFFNTLYFLFRGMYFLSHVR